MLLAIFLSSLAVVAATPLSLQGDAVVKNADLTVRQAPAGPTVRPWSNDFTYQGCWVDPGPQDNLNDRVLNSAIFINHGTNTVDLCTSQCNSAGYIFAGVEYSYLCFCSNLIGNYPTLADPSDCSYRCDGDGSEICGGLFRISVYGSGPDLGSANQSTTPVPDSRVGNYQFIGCISDSKANRPLSNPNPNNYLTPESCAASCSDTYFGLSYGLVCACGNDIDFSQYTVYDSNACDSPCTGNFSEACGAADKMAVYSNDPGAAMLTVTSPNPPTPTVNQAAILVDGGQYVYSSCTYNLVGFDRTSNMDSDSMTPAACGSFCNGSPNFALEFGNHCFCGTNNPFQSPLIAQNLCGAPCSGDDTQYCGTDYGSMIYTFESPMNTGPRLVLNTNFPDPDFIQYSGGYVAYATDNGKNPIINIQVATSNDWTTWELQNYDALGPLPPWVDTSVQDSNVWAPSVQLRNDGQYVMYYCAQPTTSNGGVGGGHCIGAALSSSPTGPFTTESTPMICLPDAPTIDPSGFIDADGTPYIVYKIDTSYNGASTPIYLQSLESDLITLTGDSPSEIFNSNGLGEGNTEAPYIVLVNGVYFLWFSTGSFIDLAYTASYATAPTVFGPYTPASQPFLQTNAYGTTSPGGMSLSPDGTKMIFHADIGTSYNSDEGRNLWTASVAYEGTMAYPAV